VESCLSNIQRSAGSARVEIVVVDGNRDSTLREVARRFGAAYVHEARSGMGVARNAGIRAATARIVAFTDDDCEVESKWTLKIIEKFSGDHELAVVGGLDLTPNGSSFFQTSIGLLDDLRGAPKQGPDLARRILNCNVAYVKRAVVACGGYDETFEICEDQELHLRLFKMGYKFCFNSQIIVYHKRRGSPSEFLRRVFWYGYWSSRVFQKHPRLFARTTGILPPTALAAFLLGAAFAFSAGFYAPLVLTILAALAYEVVWGLKIALLRPNSWRSLPVAMLALPIRNIAMALGFLAGMFRYIVTFPKARL